MAASTSRPPAYRPGEAAAVAPPPPPTRVAGPSPWFGCKQRAPESTAQANLRKIIAIISTVLPAQPHPNALQSQLVDPPQPPPPVPLELGEGESGILSAPSEAAEGQRTRFDLRLRLGPPIWEMGQRSSPEEEEDHDVGLPSSACSFVGEGTTEVTGVGGGSSEVAAPETAESRIVSENCDGASRDLGTMLGSNSSEDGSLEGEWDAGGGRAEEEEVKEAREEERGGGGADERQRRTCFEVTNIRGNTGAGAMEESDATKAGGFVGTREMVAETKRASNMDADNEGETGRRCRRRDEGYLGLLLEAVRQVSGGLFGDESPRKDQEHAEGVRVERNKKGGCWAAEDVDQYEVAGDEKHKLGPVVRSKRGRSQALPSRYRDSVLEPWKKQSGGCHHRPLQRRQTRTPR